MTPGGATNSFACAYDCAHRGERRAGGHRHGCYLVDVGLRQGILAPLLILRASAVLFQTRGENGAELALERWSRGEMSSSGGERRVLAWWACSKTCCWCVTRLSQRLPGVAVGVWFTCSGAERSARLGVLCRY